MLLRSDHRDGDLTAWFRHDIFIRKGGETRCDDLHSNGAAGGDDVDRCFALRIRLDLQIAFVLTVENGIEDDGRIWDWLAVELLQDGNFNVRGSWWRLVLATAFDIRAVLTEKSMREGQTKSQSEEQR